jgi:hypothetical protein
MLIGKLKSVTSEKSNNFISHSRVVENMGKDGGFTLRIEVRNNLMQRKQMNSFLDTEENIELWRKFAEICGQI